MDQILNGVTTENNLLKTLFHRHAKLWIKEALLEFLSENELAIVSTKETSHQLITTGEAAKMLCINRHTMYKLMQEGLPSFKIGRNHKFRVEDIDRFVIQRMKSKRLVDVG